MSPLLILLIFVVELAVLLINAVGAATINSMVSPGCVSLPLPASIAPTLGQLPRFADAFSLCSSYGPS
jgi:hypothetical protein